MLRVEFVKGYTICEETCEIWSLTSTHRFGANIKVNKGKHRKPNKMGYVNIRNKNYKPEKVYKDVFEKEWEG